MPNDREDGDTAFDLPAYLARIGLDQAPAADLAGLESVQWAQLQAIVFENLDVAMGRGISVEPAAVFAKLVTAGRGGYCHEANSLLARALTALGFDARLLAARVRSGPATEMTPRTHSLVLVRLPQGRFVADAGFGAQTPRIPLPLRHGATGGRGGLSWRLHEAGEIGWNLAMLEGGQWQDLYLFDLGQVYPADLALSNHWSASHPASLFTQGPLAVKHRPDGRNVLVGGKIIRRDAQGQQTRSVKTLPDLLAGLQADFGLTLQPDDAEALALEGALLASLRRG